MNIDRIKIVGFKSIAGVTLDQLKPYSVFAGPNGAGKSNLMDALAFVGAVIELGAIKAIRKFNGFSQIHCYKFRKNKARTFEFAIEATMKGEKLSYALKIHDMDTAPSLEEHLTVAENIILQRKKGDSPRLAHEAGGSLDEVPNMPADFSALLLTQQFPLHQYLTNIQVFRFDPLGAKEPDASSTDTSELDAHGHNVATMLAVLEKNEEFSTQITDWMALLVPGMQQVRTEQQRLDGRTVIKFKEEGIKTHLPANLISDGTIYALCIMTAVLSRSKGYGLTLMEEPERGIHPKAIEQLVALMRDNATPEHPVLVTTHSESLVRASTTEELWLINKDDGKTVVKNAAKNSGDLEHLNLDTAWLMNLFGGGLPW